MDYYEHKEVYLSVVGERNAAGAPWKILWRAEGDTEPLARAKLVDDPRAGVAYRGASVRAFATVCGPIYEGVPDEAVLSKLAEYLCWYPDDSAGYA